MFCSWGVLYINYACTEGAHMTCTRRVMHNILGMYRRSTYVVYMGSSVHYLCMYGRSTYALYTGSSVHYFCMYERSTYDLYTGSNVQYFRHVQKEYTYAV